MRDLAVFLLFSTGGILALKRPYIAALLWVWIGLMNPHRLGWGFAYDLPFAMAAAVILLFSILINRDKVNWTFARPSGILLAFVAWMGITTMFAIHVDESLERYIFVLKILLMLYPIMAVVRTREEILGLVVVISGSLAFFGLKGGLFTILTGGSSRVWGPPSSAIEGNNELAVGLIICVPLLYFLATQTTQIRSLPLLGKLSDRLIRNTGYLATFFCLVAALGSQSRGALLAMIAMGATLWWRSKSKFPLMITAIVIGVMAVAFMPEEWMGRMNTIKTYDEDASAMGRINAWTMAINIANDRITGAGFSTDSELIYQTYAPNPNFVIVAHSIYFQVLGEHGYIGLLLYLGFWISTYLLAGRVLSQSSGIETLGWIHSLASMIKVSLIGFAVGGAFLSLAFWDMPFYLFVLLVCAQRYAQGILSAKRTELPSHLQSIETPLARRAAGTWP